MDVLMPQLGETVAEGKIIRWFKSIGEAVARGDNLCEIETDKVTVEVPAITDGVLTQINAEVGTVAPVGAVIAIVANPGEEQTIRSGGKAPASAPVAATGSSAPAVQVTAEASSTRGQTPLDHFREVDTPRRNFGPARLANGIRVTPLARRLAGGASIDLLSVQRSGSRGLITGRDVEKAIAARTSVPGVAREDLIGDAYRERPHRIVAIDGMRRTIAARLTQSKATIPHFYLMTHVEVGRLASLRAEINESAPKDAAAAPAYRLSLNDFMIKALALALQELPSANAVWSDDGIFEFEHSDVAVAVAVPGGLFTPVVMAAESKSVAAISREVKSLAQRARERSLRPEEYQGGSTTISNLGMHGVEAFSAIINPPQATILAIGAATRDAVEAAAGGVAFVDRVTATLSCDHRIVDGVLGAELLGHFKSLVENPFRMLV
jgi:pyruvate dehydrogenase E2 component (dihydrolipoyllysine-residue acetyltransferase)